MECDNLMTKTGQQFEEPSTPFTGKVPPPPEASSTPVSGQKPVKPNSLRLAEPVFLPASSSTPSSVPTDDSLCKQTIDHLFTPILPQPATTPANWTTLNPPVAKVTESVGQKKKKDREMKTSGEPTPSIVREEQSAVISEPIGSELNREDVQSPAYSDISDANDQPSPSLLDAEKKKVAGKLATEIAVAGPAVHPTLGAFIYPFYGHHVPPKTVEMPEGGTASSAIPSAYGLAPDPTTVKMPDQTQFMNSSPACKQKAKKAQIGTSTTSNQSSAGMTPESSTFDSVKGQQQEERFYAGAYNSEDPGPALVNRFPSPMNSPGWMANGVKTPQQQQMMQLHMQQRQQMQHHHQLQQQFQQQLQQQLQQQHQQHMLQQQHHFQHHNKPTLKQSVPSPKARPSSADRKQEKTDGVNLAGPGMYGVLPNMHLYGHLPFDPSHPAYRNNMSAMMGGVPYPFSPSPGNGVSPVDMPNRMSPGIRGYNPAGPGFPGPSGEDRTNALEILQHHANQYYVTGQPPSTQAAPVQQFQSQRSDRTMERAMKQSPVPSTTPTGSLQPSISAHRYPPS